MTQNTVFQSIKNSFLLSQKKLIFFTILNLVIFHTTVKQIKNNLWDSFRWAVSISFLYSHSWYAILGIVYERIYHPKTNIWDWETKLHDMINNNGYFYCLPVNVVEEWEKVERQLGPALLLTLVQRGGVHDGGGVIQPRASHHRPVHVSTQLSHHTHILLYRI